MAELLEMKNSYPKEAHASSRPRPQRSTSLKDMHGDAASAKSVAAAMETDAAALSRERRRSLRGVGGEIREEPGTAGQKPDSCSEKASNSLRRTGATTSLLRSAQRSPGKTCLQANSTMLLVAAITVALFIGVLAWKQGQSGRGTHHLPADPRGPLRVRRCRNEACRRIGELLKDALDDGVQPCDDFHAYVCGSWSHKHPGKTFAEVFGSAFLDHVTRRARANAVIQHKVSNQTAVQKAATHLVACDNIVALSKDQSSDVKRVLAEGGIVLEPVEKSGSATDVLKAIFYMSQVVKIPVLLDLSVERGAEQRVVLRRPVNTKILLEESKRRLNDTASVDTASEEYDEYVRTIYDSFSGSENSSESDELSRNVRRLESGFVACLSTSLAGNKEGKASVWFSSTASIHHISRTISKDRWLKAFQVFLSIPEERDIPVAVYAGTYVKTLFTLHEKLGEADFAQLYAWLCIQALVPFTSGRIVSAQGAARRSTVLQRHRWQCFHSTERVFHYALGYPYLADVTTENVKRMWSC
ncbi:hypothetical protein HPB50_001623 [Hyalomma asiaticum]|uniref:Uncharacterized protein n=1 Tax=Hyalomma asiaticum TaxID=266040 RepID=A0ACB7SIU5_HYAAI|nr:hypothetical protein HPB50_001623 [Hyalomma asiaticum]